MRKNTLIIKVIVAQVIMRVKVNSNVGRYVFVNIMSYIYIFMYFNIFSLC